MHFAYGTPVPVFFVPFVPFVDYDFFIICMSNIKKTTTFPQVRFLQSVLLFAAGFLIIAF